MWQLIRFIYCLHILITFCRCQELQKTNLLYIMFDDLRPELSIYGRSHMITPNFERLAKQSVVFDNAFAQIAVCNPSRDSLLTGLRPDTIGVYAFQSSFPPHLVFPRQLIESGYNTAGFGKILHWESNDRSIWNYDSWENDWYNYQNAERGWMNSSTMPDKNQPEEKFRDYLFTTRAIETMRKLHALPKYFMVALGFKLPHLAVHIPDKYYQMYKGRSDAWALSKKELRFPPSAPSIGYRCCPEPVFHYMNKEGSVPAAKSVHLGDINMVFTEQMHDELMHGYCAAITFLDTQIGRLLDVVDELKLWNNLTIVLTADHGMHNGEKGMWEKWTVYDESTRVPLMISHPQSPNKGQHYEFPVELLDIYPTLNDLLLQDFDRSKNCPPGAICRPLSGKSLLPAILGKPSKSKFIAHDSPSGLKASNSSIPPLERVFSVSQSLRCANKLRLMEEASMLKKSIPGQHKLVRQQIWGDCDLNRRPQPTDEVALMGYSMRTLEYRYTAWVHFDRVNVVPLLDIPPYFEELYDHRGETPDDYTHLEIVNLVSKGGYEAVVLRHRDSLMDFVKKGILFKSVLEKQRQ